MRERFVKVKGEGKPGARGEGVEGGLP